MSTLSAKQQLKWGQEKNVRNAIHIYSIRLFKRHLHGTVSVAVGFVNAVGVSVAVAVGVSVTVCVSVDVAVDFAVVAASADVAVVDVVAVLFFMLLIYFLNKRQTKMKLKVSFNKSEHKNWGNAHCKYAMRSFN